jgi:hypothetical protein
LTVFMKRYMLVASICAAVGFYSNCAMSGVTPVLYGFVIADLKI